MFSALSIIISSYVILRACEIILKPKSACRTETARVIMIILALIVIVVAAVGALSILTVSSNIETRGLWH